jgi:phosphatidylglycerophosphatase A
MHGFTVTNFFEKIMYCLFIVAAIFLFVLLFVLFNYVEKVKGWFIPKVVACL